MSLHASTFNALWSTPNLRSIPVDLEVRTIEIEVELNQWTWALPCLGGEACLLWGSEVTAFPFPIQDPLFYCVFIVR
jgi:hypothetical protein